MSLACVNPIYKSIRALLLNVTLSVNTSRRAEEEGRNKLSHIFQFLLAICQAPTIFLSFNSCPVSVLQ